MGCSWQSISHHFLSNCFDRNNWRKLEPLDWTRFTPVAGGRIRDCLLIPTGDENPINTWRRWIFLKGYIHLSSVNLLVPYVYHQELFHQAVQMILTLFFYVSSWPVIGQYLIVLTVYFHLIVNISTIVVSCSCRPALESTTTTSLRKSISIPLTSCSSLFLGLSISLFSVTTPSLLNAIDAQQCYRSVLLQGIIHSQPTSTTKRPTQSYYVNVRNLFDWRIFVRPSCWRPSVFGDDRLYFFLGAPPTRT